MASAEGGFILSGGFGDSDHELARWAVHRFDREGRPVKSWHPALNHPKWETVRRASGGPVALTKDGGLLVSDAAPFRITRYGDLLGTGPQVVIEDEEVVSASEVDRAATYQADGYILARTPVETGCGGLSAKPDGYFLATCWGDPEHALAKLEVEVRSSTEASPAPAAGCVGG